jgi:uncharacterized protein (TIGR03435 family)
MRTVILLILFFAVSAPAQTTTPPPTPAFEVATVKPSDPAACCGRTFGTDGRRFYTTNTNLKYLIQWAYNLQANQVIPGSAWMDHTWWDDARFDLFGQIEGASAPNAHEWKLAVQGLLADRFQVKFHHETRELAAYELVLAKGGPKLTPGDGDTQHHQRMGFSGSVGQTMRGTGFNASIADFIGELQRIVLDRPVVDRTGLTGVYDIQFAFTREDPQALGMSTLPDNAAPNLFTALQQELGLKLEPTKAPVDVLVIDHAEKPSAN